MEPEPAYLSRKISRCRMCSCVSSGKLNCLHYFLAHLLLSANETFVVLIFNKCFITPEENHFLPKFIFLSLAGFLGRNKTSFVLQHMPKCIRFLVQASFVICIKSMRAYTLGSSVLIRAK